MFTRTGWSCVAVALLVTSMAVHGQNSTGPAGGVDPATGEFNDLKSPPLKTSDLWGTACMIHINDPNAPAGIPAITNYAGFLFDLEYDGSEVFDIGILPAGPHTHIEIPGLVPNSPGFLTSQSWFFFGSDNQVHREEPLAAWINPAQAMASGIILDNSQVTSLVFVDFHAKNTTTANNSDIDIRVSQLGVIRHVPSIQQSQFAVLPASAWVYVTPDNDPALSQVVWAQNGPGSGPGSTCRSARTFTLRVAPSSPRRCSTATRRVTASNMRFPSRPRSAC